MIEKLLSPLIAIIRTKKKYVLLTLVSAVLFAVLLFPYGDLADLITDMIAKNSNNQVFVQFDDLGIGFAPPSLKMSNVAVDTPFLPTIKADRLYLAPSFAGLLAFKPGFTSNIDGFMKGDVKISYRAGKKINDQTWLQNLSVGLDKLDLAGVSKLAGVPFNLEGRINADLDTEFDPMFIEQPNGQYQVTINNFDLPSATVATPIGPFPLPQIKLSKLVLKGEFKNSKFIIQEGVVGAPGDSLSGSITGQMGIRMSKQGNSLVPDLRDYNLNVDLSLDLATEKSLSVALNLVSALSSYKTATGTGSRYAFNLSAASFGALPKIGPITR